MRSTRARRAAMIGTAALLLVAPCATLAQAEPTPPAPALPADMVAAIQRDLGLNPAQYLDQAETGQKLAAFADTLRGKFPTTFSGVWLDAAGAPLVGLADGPDKAAARTAVEAAGYQVKDQPRSERTLNDLLGQLNTWVQQLPAPLSGLVNGTTIDPVANDISLEVKDTAAGQGLQLPDFLSFVRVVKGPDVTSELPGLGSLGSSGSSDPTKPTEPTDPTGPTDTTVALDPVTGATVGKKITLKAKVKPAAAGGTVEFKDGDTVLGTGQVGANGEATYQWTPATDGQRTITATFSGRDGVTGSNTTRQVAVAKADSNTVASTTTLDPVKGATVGKAITLKAKVKPAAAGGNVEFKDGDTVLGSAKVGANGEATYQWTPETDGPATVYALFSGRDGVAGSTSTDQQFTVAKAEGNIVASTITIDPIEGAIVRKAITLKARVTPAAAGGTITFENFGPWDPVPVGADGTATVEWYPTFEGNDTVTATFSGRDGVTGSKTTQQVAVASDDVASTTALDPIAGDVVGKTITLKAKVNPAAAGGTVEFKDGRTVLGTAKVGANGTATYQWIPTASGQRTITATFSGRDGVAGSNTTQKVTITKPKLPADAITGGTGYRTGEISDGECSFGFNGTDASGDVVNISAGHCDPDREEAGGGNATQVRQSGTQRWLLGNFDTSVVDGGDYAVIKMIDEAAHRFENNYINTYGGDPLPITGIADPVVGAPVCKSGDRTGFTCGRILGINERLTTSWPGNKPGATVKDSFRTNACILPGDSGGAMVTGTQALGLSAGTNDYVECKKSAVGWGQPIKSVLRAIPGLKVRTN